MQHPVANARVLDVHELRADRVGVNSLQPRDHFTQLHFLIIEEELRRYAKIEVFFAEAQLAQRELRIFRALFRQWVDPRNGVTKRAIRIDQSVDARLQQAFANASPRRSRSGAIPLGQIAELESFEKRRPPRIDRFRVLTPAPVVLLDQVEICPSSD